MCLQGRPHARTSARPRTRAPALSPAPAYPASRFPAHLHACTHVHPLAAGRSHEHPQARTPASTPTRTTARPAPAAHALPPALLHARALTLPCAHAHPDRTTALSHTPARPAHTHARSRSTWQCELAGARVCSGMHERMHPHTPARFARLPSHTHARTHRDARTHAFPPELPRARMPALSNTQAHWQACGHSGVRACGLDVRADCLRACVRERRQVCVPVCLLVSRGAFESC